MLDEYGVAGNRSFDEEAFAAKFRQARHGNVDVFASEEAAFPGIGIERGDGNSRLGDPETPQGLIGQFHDATNAFRFEATWNIVQGASPPGGATIQALPAEVPKAGNAPGINCQGCEPSPDQYRLSKVAATVSP
jgi:hypothetical protein